MDRSDKYLEKRRIPNLDVTDRAGFTTSISTLMQDYHQEQLQKKIEEIEVDKEYYKVAKKIWDESKKEDTQTHEFDEFYSGLLIREYVLNTLKGE